MATQPGCGAVIGAPIRFDHGQESTDPPLTDVVVQGNVISNPGPAKYRFAVIVEGEPNAPARPALDQQYLSARHRIVLQQSQHTIRALVTTPQPQALAAVFERNGFPKDMSPMVTIRALCLRTAATVEMYPGYTGLQVEGLALSLRQSYGARMSKRRGKSDYWQDAPMLAIRWFLIPTALRT